MTHGSQGPSFSAAKRPPQTQILGTLALAAAMLALTLSAHAEAPKAVDKGKSMTSSSDAASPSAEGAKAAPAESEEPAPRTSVKTMERLAGDACPGDMVYARGFCVDRYESSLVDKDTGEPLSPYYPPHPRLLRSSFSTWELLRTSSGEPAARRMPLPALSAWQRTHEFEPKALSLPGRVPQAYMSYHTAKRACLNAGKRLCTEEEWAVACRGRWQTQYPYGNEFRRMSCNVYRYVHPAHVLHGLSSFSQLDPRYNLISVGDDGPVLRDTGAMPNCKSPWWSGMVAHDMVGNLDEWVEDEAGTFRGAFYARASTKGCEAQVTSHTPDYYDYSTGARCCRDPLTEEAAEAN